VLIAVLVGACRPSPIQGASAPVSGIGPAEPQKPPLARSAGSDVPTVRPTAGSPTAAGCACPAGIPGDRPPHVRATAAGFSDDRRIYPCDRP